MLAHHISRIASRTLFLAALLAAACREPVSPLTRIPAPSRPTRDELVEDPSCDRARFDCSVPLAYYYSPSRYSGASQPDTVTFWFFPPIQRLILSGQGTVLCSGQYGNVIAYANDTTPIRIQPLHLEDFCMGPAPGYSYSVGDTLYSAVPITMAKITAMAPLRWQLPGVDPQVAEQFWSVTGQRYGGKSSIRFDAHPRLIKPSTYPFAAKSDCRAGDGLRVHHWGLTLAESIGTSVVPKSLQEVTLSLGAVEPSGGHRAHLGNRPVGSFTPGTTKFTTTTVVTTDGNGHAAFDYYAGEFGGDYWIRAEHSGVGAEDRFQIGVPLLPMPGMYVNWSPYGRGRELHDNASVYFTDPTMRRAADTLASHYAARYPGKRLEFNDMGLPLGGRFDINGRWAADADHCSHRWGNALDLHTNDLPSEEFDWVGLEWLRLTHLQPLHHKNHYHLPTTRVF